MTITPRAWTCPGRRRRVRPDGLRGGPAALLPARGPDHRPRHGRAGAVRQPEPGRHHPYSDAINAHCPYAYGWSGNDQVPGNQVVRNCRACSGFTVTFH
ncbi:hypothetical protein NKH77_05065 [Streptomyces sp. M19]